MDGTPTFPLMDKNMNEKKLDSWMDVLWMDGSMDGWMDGWMDV